MSTNKSVLQSINSAENQDAMKNQEGKKKQNFQWGDLGKLHKRNDIGPGLEGWICS